MTHPQRFLQTILARPADDSPRLRYARWLSGCGNPLGEFIHLQCLLARQPAGEPHMLHERRTQELLADFRGPWTQNLDGCVAWCSFRRGFIEEVSLSDKQLIRHAAELFQNAPVLDIHLETDGKRLDRLPAVPGVSHTIFLDLSSQSLGDAGIERLADAPLLTQVHGLNLGSTYMGNLGLAALADSPRLGNLRELYLNDNPISDDGIRQFVMSPLVEQLEMLDVRYTQISREGIDVLRRILADKVLCGNSAR
jgi:uncharacterized protein (TIGR02996 family)